MRTVPQVPNRVFTDIKFEHSSVDGYLRRDLGPVRCLAYHWVRRRLKVGAVNMRGRRIPTTADSIHITITKCLFGTPFSKTTRSFLLFNHSPSNCPVLVEDAFCLKDLHRRSPRSRPRPSPRRVRAREGAKVKGGGGGKEEVRRY